MTDAYEQYNLNFISADGSIKSISVLAHNLRKMNFFSALIDEGEQQFDCLFVQMNANNITILNNEYLNYDSFLLLLNFLVHGSNSYYMNSPYALRAFKEAANFCQAEGVLEIFINQEKRNIKAAQFINAHYPAQLIYDAYKDQLNVECLISEFLKYPCYSESLICGLGYTAMQLRRNNICLDAVVQANCFSDEEVISAYGAIDAIAFINAGISLKALVKHGHKGYGLKDTQYTARELKEIGFNAKQLKTAGFTAVELKDVGFDCGQLRIAGFRAWELKAAGFTVEDFIFAAFGLETLKSVDFTASELKALGCSAVELKNVGFTAMELKEAFFTAKELKEADFSDWQLRAVQFTILELKEAGLSASRLRMVGFTAEQLKAADFNAELLIEAAIKAKDLIRIGFNVSQLTTAYLSYFKNNELDHTSIVEMIAFDRLYARRIEDAKQKKQYYGGLVSLELLEHCGLENEDILNRGAYLKAEIAHRTSSFSSFSSYRKSKYYDARDIMGICFKNNGVSAKELKDAGFSVNHLKVAEFTLNEIIVAGYTLKEIRQSQQYSDAKITKEANTISAQSHQPELTSQLREMRHANDCCSAM